MAYYNGMNKIFRAQQWQTKTMQNEVGLRTVQEYRMTFSGEFNNANLTLALIVQSHEFPIHSHFFRKIAVAVALWTHLPIAPHFVLSNRYDASLK